MVPSAYFRKEGSPYYLWQKARKLGNTFDPIYIKRVKWEVQHWSLISKIVRPTQTYHIEKNLGKNLTK